MFAEDFNPTATLVTETCPRCHTVGLVVPDDETCRNTPEAEWFTGPFIVCPSIAAMCPACGLLGHWPGMCYEVDVKPKRKPRKPLKKAHGVS